MIVQDLLDIILRLRLTGRDGESDILFDSGDPLSDPLRINGVFLDEDGDLCLESDEIVELDDYVIGDLLDVLSALPQEMKVYFYDDESGEFYGIHQDEARVETDGDVWIKVR